MSRQPHANKEKGMPVSDWKPWDGSYEKEWHDVMLPDGEVVEHCWPNAGVMCASDGTGRMWTHHDNIRVRTGRHPFIRDRTEPKEQP